MLMDSNVATQQTDTEFAYYIIAGSSAWYLNFETSFNTEFCPSTLTGMTIKIDGVVPDPKEYSFINFTKNANIEMAGRFESDAIGTYSKAATYNMTIDLFDPLKPHLEIRAAVIVLNIVEKNKTNPVFVSPLNLT